MNIYREAYFEIEMFNRKLFLDAHDAHLILHLTHDSSFQPHMNKMSGNTAKRVLCLLELKVAEAGSFIEVLCGLFVDHVGRCIQCVCTAI